MCFFFYKRKTAYDMRISDWSSDVCSSDLQHVSPGKQRNRMVCKSPVARTLEPNADFTMMILGNASGIKRLLRIDGRPEPHPPTNMRVAGSLKIEHQILSFDAVFHT